MQTEKLIGDIDIIHADDFKAKYVGILSESGADIVFDCAGLDFVDSTGLGAFAAIANKAAEVGAKVSLKNLKPAIAKLFNITKLSSVIAIIG